jgi:plastocyanin domain-containing protein
MNRTIVLINITIFSITTIAFVIFNRTTSEDSIELKSSSLGTSVINQENKQIIELIAKGGYFPATIQASANKATILRIKTNNTFDCSSALTIPSLGINKRLPQTGSTDIEIEPRNAGTQIDGTCSMGMYYFSIKFI